MAPCNYIHDYVGDVGDTIHPECEFDPVKQFEYLSSIRIVLLHNSGRLDPEKFGDESIIRESKIISQQVNPYTPSYVSLFCRMNELDDETQFVQYGFSDLATYIDVIKDEPGISSWSDDLIKNPGGRYKYVSMELNFSQDLHVTTRQTYSLLDWLGDIGGLLDALRYTVQLLMLPYVGYTSKTFLMTRLFQF